MTLLENQDDNSVIKLKIVEKNDDLMIEAIHVRTDHDESSPLFFVRSTRGEDFGQYSSLEEAQEVLKQISMMDSSVRSFMVYGGLE